MLLSVLMVGDFTSKCLDMMQHRCLPTSPIRFSKKYDFAKPNEKRALNLMNEAAVAVLKDLPDIGIAYGMSDEFR